MRFIPATAPAARRDGSTSATRTARRTARIAASLLVASSLTLPSLMPSVALAARLDSDLIAGTPLSQGKVPKAKAPDVTMKAGVLVAPGSSELWARQADSRRAIASITKLMTALVVLEQCRLDETVTVTKEASKVDYAVGLQEGERTTVRQLLEYALVASSNDAALALAAYAGGSTDQFVTLMNAKVKTLGLKGTAFKNPHGLDEKGHYSSAADVAVLMQAAMEYPEFRRISQLRSVTLPARGKRGAKQLKATNRLLGRCDGLLCGKTGFTDDAGRSFVASAERGGVTLTAVVLSAGGDPQRFDQARRLLEWGFAHLKPVRLGGASSIAGSVPVAANPSHRIDLRYETSATVAVFDLGGEVTSKTVLAPSVKLPVFEGQELGEVVFAQGGKPLARVPLVAASDLVSAQETVGAIPVADYIDRAVTVRAAASGWDVKEYDTAAPLRRVVDLAPDVSAPVQAGQVVGEIVYSQHGRLIARVPAVAAETVERPGVARAIGIWFARGWRSLTGKPTMARLSVFEV